ncbi:MAG: indole-3-glycerol phosphate synthase TrpC [Bacteroidia bacterium]
MTILHTIIKAKRESLKLQKLAIPVGKLRPRPGQYSMRNALESSPTGIIAEIKRAAPSSGSLNEAIDVAKLAKAYEQAGAAAISVLTDEAYFKGSLDDLRAVREAVSIPVLRKDFIIDEYQLLEAADAGADCVLLIAAALSVEEAIRLSFFAKHLGLEVLLEVHNQKELDSHGQVPCDLIGVNNRNLKEFSIDLNISKLLATNLPTGPLPISESGIRSAEEILQLRQHGYRGFLIGSHFMRKANPAKALHALLTRLSQKEPSSQKS